MAAIGNLTRVTRGDPPAGEGDPAGDWVFSEYRAADAYRQPTPTEIDAMGDDTEMYAAYLEDTFVLRLKLAVAW